MKKFIDIEHFDYPLPEERIAKYPLTRRSESKLLLYRDNQITDLQFNNLLEQLPKNAFFAFNQTKVIRARLVMYKPTGARIEIFCLEPASPSDYERAFAVRGASSWHCMVGNAKKFNTTLSIEDGAFRATKGEGDIVHFEWSTDETFGELLERLGRVPIPPYLNRDSEELDSSRYQTTYAQIEGSVAAPTAGLHFTEDILERIDNRAFVTLHVGAGTFLPVKVDNAAEHKMHTETFEVSLENLEKLAQNEGQIIAVGTTTVRTLESLAVMGGRVLESGEAEPQRAVGQWESYPTRSLKPLVKWLKAKEMKSIKGATQIMITPGYKFVTIKALITNFHQPKSTLLLLISAIVGKEWKTIYNHALENDYRFLSYGDSSILEIERVDIKE